MIAEKKKILQCHIVPEYDEESVTTSSSSSSNQPQKGRQICFTLAVCLICIPCGNLIGYTSSAIPSIRDGEGNQLFNIAPLFPPHNLSKFALNRTKTSHTFHLGDTEERLFDSRETIDELKAQKPKPRVKPHFMGLTESQASWIGGLAPLGAFIGCFVAPLPLKTYGPKGTVLRVSATAFLISWFLTAFAPSLQFVFIGRSLGGFALGVTFAVVPLYILETTSVELRGPLGTLSQFLFTVGVLMGFIFGYFFDWRICAFICAVLTIPVFIILPFIPESPIWLLSVNRFDDADSSYHKIRSYSPEYERIRDRALFDVNRNPFQSRKSIRSDYSEFCKPHARRSIFVALFLCVFQQLTGINAVNFYTVTIFESAAGAETVLDGHLSAIIVAFVFCIANSLSYILIEKLGRKSLLLLSTILISLTNFTLGLYFYYVEQEVDTTEFDIVPLISLVVFMFAFSIGYGPLLYVLVAEVLPNEIRNLINPIAIGVNWVSVFLISKTFPDIILLIGESGAFWVYALCSLVSAIFTVFYIPETKGKTEEEILMFFTKKNSAASSSDSSTAIISE